MQVFSTNLNNFRVFWKNNICYKSSTFAPDLKKTYNQLK